jgi:phosphohistidine phosphatase
MLLRHAKSSWDDGIAHDLDRPLAPRGRLAAPLIGAHMAGHGLLPDIVLCSAAVRTRETLALVGEAWRRAPGSGCEPEIVHETDLYLADADRLLRRLRAVPAIRRRVLMVGHNPGFEDLARRLTGRGGSDDRARLAEKYPTGALAVLTFEAHAWSEVRAGAGTLVSFVTPRALAGTT